MQWSDIQFSPSDKTLRQFAGLFLVIFGGLAAYEVITAGPSRLAIAYGAAAALVGCAGLIRPSLIKPVFVGWSIVAFPIGFVVSTVILAILYFGLFTPLALAFRAAGRDVLGLRRRDTQSYWQPKAVAADPREYFRQS
jgi:hypothetical protein